MPARRAPCYLLTLLIRVSLAEEKGGPHPDFKAAFGNQTDVLPAEEVGCVSAAGSLAPLA